MSSLLKKLKTENVRLPRFDQPDIYENVIITGITGEQRKKKDGSVIQSLLFLKLAQLNPETGNKLREEDFAFWPTKHDKGGYNFAWYATNLVTTLSEFLECYYPFDQLESSFDPFSAFGLTEDNYAKDVKKVLGIKKNMDAFNERIRDLFIAHVSQIVENAEYNLPIRIKVVPSNDGKYMGLADQHWAESMTAVPAEKSQMSITTKDLELISKWRAIKTGTPAVGAGVPPMAGASANPSGANIPGATIPGAGMPGMGQQGQPGNPANVPNAQAPQSNTIPTTQNQPVQSEQPQAPVNQGQPAGAPTTQESSPASDAGQPIPGFPNGNGAPKAGSGIPNPFNNNQQKAF